MSENTFVDYGVEAEIRKGERGRFAVWDLGKVVWPDGTFTRITSITNESKTEPGNFGSLAAAVYRLQNGRLLRGTVNAIGRQAVRDFAQNGQVAFQVTGVVQGLKDAREITRSVVVAHNDSRNRAGAVNELARQIADSVATNAYVYLNENGWKSSRALAAEEASAEAEDDTEALV